MREKAGVQELAAHDRKKYPLPRLSRTHSRPQSPRSFWPAAGNRELWEQPFQACAVDADCVRPDGQNSVISIVISKWLLPELSFTDRWSRGTRLWERDCS